MSFAQDYGSRPSGGRAMSPTPGQSPEENLVNDFKRDVAQLTRKVAAITRNVNQIGTDKDSEELRRSVVAELNSVKESVKRLNDAAKEISRKSAQIDSNSTLKRQKDNSLATFTKECGKFQDVYKLALEKEKLPIPEAAIHRQQKIRRAATDADADETTSLIESGRREELGRVAAQQEYLDGINIDRSEEISKLENDMVTINSMFRDIAGMVQEQGIIVDTIESNTMEAAKVTEEGVQQIEKAQEYQKKSRRKMCILLNVAVVILIAVFLVLLFTVIL